MDETVGVSKQMERGGPGAQGSALSTWFVKARKSRVLLLILVNLVFMLVIGALKPVFLSPKNLSVIFTNLSLETIVMSAVVMLLVAGLFDLSLDGVAAMAGVIAGKLMEAGVHAIPSVAAGLASGLLIGAMNGFAVNKLKVNPLMCTLATWWVTLGVAYGITRSISPYGFPEGFQLIGQARVLGMKVFVFYALAALILFSVWLNKTRFGFHVFATGGDRRAARLHGVKTDRLGISLYMVAALAAAFIGIVLAARLNAATPNAVDGMTLRLIAASVIGGAALSGGKGSVVGAFLGLLLMSILTNAMILFGITPFWQKGIIGGILLAAILLDAVGRLKETRD